MSPPRPVTVSTSAVAEIDATRAALAPLVDLLATLVAERARPTLGETHASATLGWISLHVLGAELLGSAAPSAGRDWCKRHGVPYKRDGKHNFARVADVRRALEGLPANDAVAPKSDRIGGLLARAAMGEK